MIRNRKSSSYNLSYNYYRRYER